jgi:hypothetical protein
MLERLKCFISAAGLTGLRQPDQMLSGATCLVMANMLMDAEFGHFLVSGVHPASGYAEVGTASQRFASQVLKRHRQVVGSPSTDQRWAMSWTQDVGIPPWAASRELSMTSARCAPPVRYLWYPVFRPDRALDLVTRSLRRGQPALVYVSSIRRPQHVVLAVAADHKALSCYDPMSGQVRALDRSRSMIEAARRRRPARPAYIVIPTGRRASS